MKFTRVITLLLILLIFLAGCAKTKQYSYTEVEKEYKEMREKALSDSLSAQDSYLQYADLFQHIAAGDKSEQMAFANLVREIAKNAAEFKDEEVFDLAAEYAIMFSQLATGKAELGIQDIFINGTHGEMDIEIVYVGDIQYSVKMIVSGDAWYSDGEEIQYEGEIGQNLLEISFYDTLPSKTFLEKFPNETNKRIATGNGGRSYELICKGIYTADHGYMIYIGSDLQFFVETVEKRKVDRPMGNIELKLETNT